MHEAFSSALRKPPLRRTHYFTSAKTPAPIAYNSRATRVALIQLTLSPEIFLIQAGHPIEDSGEVRGPVILVAESGPALVQFPEKDDIANGAAIGWPDGDTLDVPQLILTAQGISRQPFSDNCRLAWICHDYLADPRDRDHILKALSQERHLTLTQAAKDCRYSEDPISAVLSLVCSDFIEADLQTSPLGPTTLVRARRRKGAFA
jgi:hypothetical protein